MDKKHLAAALVAALGITLDGAAFARTETSAMKVKDTSATTHRLSLADQGDQGSADKGAESSCKGKEAACKGKENSCKGKQAKGKESSCKGKESACKGKENSCKGKQQ